MSPKILNFLLMDTTSEQTIFDPGAVIADRYEIIERIGAGGMGTVLRVVDRTLDNDEIALKLLFPHMSQDEVLLARFRNEVILARKLSHPNIVRLYDLGSAGNGYFYITMEYIEGRSLGDILRNGVQNPCERLSFTEILQILFQTSLALHYAHNEGVVHRDLKPDNILLTADYNVKLTDFGLARSLDTDKGLTNTGETVGTPFYMAPEQLRGEKPTGAVDIYALGLMAFEMVSGQRPFESDSYLQLAAMHMRNPIPDLDPKNREVPRWFQIFVEICAEKRPEDRYQSMSEVAKELYDEMTDMGITPKGLWGPFESPDALRRKTERWPFSLFK